MIRRNIGLRTGSKLKRATGKGEVDKSVKLFSSGGVQHWTFSDRKLAVIFRAKLFDRSHNYKVFCISMQV